MPKPGYKRIRVLITVKTYPIPSSSYDELSCTAGISDDGGFIRLYPINYRDLPPGKKFKKYQWIEVDVVKHTGRDYRKESFRPDCETIQFLGERIPTKNGDWSKRGKFVLPLVSKSMEDLYEKQELDYTSLGIFKPKKIKDLVYEEVEEREWKQSQLDNLKQMRLWDERKASKEPPKKVPYRFRYLFECKDERCKGRHKMMIEDWEVGRLYWRNIDDGKTEMESCEAVKRRFLDEICSKKNEVYFYVGTVLGWNSWVILGVFYPKVGRSGVRVQEEFQLS